ncbi:hypothetical protein HOLleu_19249 [Holothuria leucospilota]|uniref:Uncharacterized protein n=1 Tax=Holothuria leucospilota TaxID=206669 RepID=A0A9Q1BZ29_HOLLE|nr:hypothetical protein HOLleu_19249 [Holothuria leucospilota]
MDVVLKSDQMRWYRLIGQVRGTNFQENEENAGISDGIGKADYIVIAGVGLIFLLAILFCCKEFYLCISNCSQERRARKQREHVKLIEQRSLDLSRCTSTVTVQEDTRRYSRVNTEEEEIVTVPDTPKSPGGWKMTRCNSEEMIYTYPTETPLEDVREHDETLTVRNQQKQRRVTWHGLSGGVVDLHLWRGLGDRIRETTPEDFTIKEEPVED